MTFTRVLNLDYETYSAEDLLKHGMYRYMEDPEFEIMLLSYSFDGGPVKSVDLMQKRHLPPRQRVPAEFLEALEDPTCQKRAQNAPFEMNGSRVFFGIEIDPRQWKCTMIQAGSCGLPFALEAVGRILKINEQKDGNGYALIKYFCMPCAPTIANGGRTRNLPEHDRTKWDQFKRYCDQDVRSEISVAKEVDFLVQPPFEHELWCLDYVINSTGIKVDLKLIHNAVKLNHDFRERLTKELFDMTGITKPNAVKQIIKWLEEEEDIEGEIKSLKKDNIPAVLRKLTTDKSKRVLEIRQQMSKTSVGKYSKMLAYVCKDGRIRGLFQFLGANRTGRWAGRGLQFHNLPKSKLSDYLLNAARELVLSADGELLEIIFGAIPDTLSQLIRTAFIAEEGHEFPVSDFKSIEARVISWLANETWRLDVFAGDGKIYEATGARMFNIPIEEVTKGSTYRDAAKVGELACIAFGELVLTDQGLIRIECILPEHKVWDGENWVNHGGLIWRGRKHVVTYEGLTATPDHRVWVDGLTKPIDFKKAYMDGWVLTQTGHDEKPIKVKHEGLPFSRGGKWENVGTRDTFDLLNCGPNNRFTVSGKLVHNCGFNGGIDALVRMCITYKIEIPDELMKPFDKNGHDTNLIVENWRTANPKIVKLWKAMQKAAVMCIQNGCRVMLTDIRNYDGSIMVDTERGIAFEYHKGHMLIRLPSGRRLCYWNASLEDGKYGKEVIYYGLNQVTKQWCKQRTYGGKLVENAVQGIARDCLASGLINLHRAGISVPAHVHDEAVPEVKKDSVTLERINELMCKKVRWMKDLPLDAEGFVGRYYKKEQ